MTTPAHQLTYVASGLILLSLVIPWAQAPLVGAMTIWQIDLGAPLAAGGAVAAGFGYMQANRPSALGAIMICLVALASGSVAAMWLFQAQASMAEMREQLANNPFGAMAAGAGVQGGAYLMIAGCLAAFFSPLVALSHPPSGRQPPTGHANAR